MAEAGSRKLVVSEFVTLDGVMQAPGAVDEDDEGGFEHGGWQLPYFRDAVMDDAVEEAMAAADALLLGRKTYDLFARFWPTAKEPFADRMNGYTKYVASTTRKKLEWKGSILLEGDVAPEIARLKRQPGKDLLVFGSGRLVQTLLRHELVDELLLMTHPVILGSGKRLFQEEADRGRAFELEAAKPTPKGVVVARYRAVQS